MQVLCGKTYKMYYRHEWEKMTQARCLVPQPAPQFKHNSNPPPTELLVGGRSKGNTMIQVTIPDTSGKRTPLPQNVCQQNLRRVQSLTGLQGKSQQSPPAMPLWGTWAQRLSRLLDRQQHRSELSRTSEGCRAVFKPHSLAFFLGTIPGSASRG